MKTTHQGTLSGQWEEAAFSRRVTVPPTLLVWVESPSRRADLSIALETAETKPLPVANVMSGR